MKLKFSAGSMSRNIQLHNCNFTRADVSKSVFAENIHSMISVAFSHDGKARGSGDRLFCDLLTFV